MRFLLTASDNSELSAWQGANLALTWAVRQRPWEVEADVIALMQPPLNLATNAAHSFHGTVREARAAFRQRATSGH